MTEMTRFPPGRFCWIDLATSDWKAAAQFYASLFGWTSAEMPMGPDQPPYIMLRKDGKDVGALYENRDAPPAWTSYVAVADADEAANRAKSFGATLVSNPYDVFEAGRMALVDDPQGIRFAIWQPRKNPGLGLVDEPNTLCWNELYTTDLAAAREFYSSLFGWKLKITPEYTEISAGEAPFAGMLQMKPMKGWFPYFSVTDCHRTAEAAKSLGARVHVEKEIEHVGRFAFLGDPQGATFAVIQLAPR